MPKFYGMIGFEQTHEDPPESGIWKEEIVERPFYGDVVRNSRRLGNGGEINSNVQISNSISIVADKDAYANFHQIRYAVWQGVKWRVESIDASNPPRLTLELGSRYTAEPDGN